MYNPDKAIITLGLFLVFIFFFVALRFSPVLHRASNNNVPAYLVSYKNRIWWISQNGKLLYTAALADVLKKAVVSGADIRELSVSKGSLEIIAKLKDALNDPCVTEIKLNQKCAILLKGVVLYFSDWEDLVNHVSLLKDLILVMEPKAEYFLTSSGLVYKIRGGGGEEK